MKKHYGALILSALMAGAVFTGCGPVENLDAPVAESPVTEAAVEEVTEAEIITEEETEAATEPVTEETEPAVTEAASKREANLAALEDAQEIEFGKCDDDIRLHSFTEIFEMGCANASDTVDGMAMALYNLDNAAGTRFYDFAYTTDAGQTWAVSESKSELLRITSGFNTFIPLGNGDILLFRYKGADYNGVPIVQLITQSASDPKPKLSGNIYLKDYIETDDTQEYEVSYNGSGILHVDCMSEENDEPTGSYDINLDELEFVFEE